MKVIDLLNKIANSEEVPKHIKYKNFNFYFDTCEYRDFYEEITYFDLNDEVEIIEEEQDIEELEGLYILQGNDAAMPDTLQDCNNRKLIKKINELIKAVNELKKNER